MVRTLMKKYTINYQNINYNPRTRLYEGCGGNVYSTYQDARTSKWKCDKCDQLFSSYTNVRSHKSEFHSY